MRLNSQPDTTMPNEFDTAYQPVRRFGYNWRVGTRKLAGDVPSRFVAEFSGIQRVVERCLNSSERSSYGHTVAKHPVLVRDVG
jgi:hypothetical protein